MTSSADWMKRDSISSYPLRDWVESGKAAKTKFTIPFGQGQVF
jgi:hypothetical protein